MSINNFQQLPKNLTSAGNDEGIDKLYGTGLSPKFSMIKASNFFAYRATLIYIYWPLINKLYEKG